MLEVVCRIRTLKTPNYYAFQVRSQTDFILFKDLNQCAVLDRNVGTVYYKINVQVWSNLWNMNYPFQVNVYADTWYSLRTWKEPSRISASVLYVHQIKLINFVYISDQSLTRINLRESKFNTPKKLLIRSTG